MTNWLRSGGNEVGFDIFHCEEREVCDGSEVVLNLKDFGAARDVVVKVRDGVRCARIWERVPKDTRPKCPVGWCHSFKGQRVFEVVSVTSPDGEPLRPYDYGAQIAEAVRTLV